MTEANCRRFWGLPHALDHPVSRVLIGVTVALLVLAPIAIFVLHRARLVTGEHRRELLRRYYSWLAIIPMMLGPVLLGAAWAILGAGALSLACYREFARATGMFREKLVSLIVVAGIVLVTFASLDHWYGLFMAMGPITVVAVAAGAIVQDRPKGYIQRVGLGVLAFMLLGIGLGHLGYFANDARFVPILLVLMFAVELNDVAAYCFGKSLGRRKLIPNTSPNKTQAGAMGAIAVTTPLVAVLAHFVFRATPIDRSLHLITLGLVVSLLGQLGDLLLSSVKRDLGLKDFAQTIPGHGGLLDRFDSLVLVAPAVFHYIGYFNGIGLNQPTRVLTG